MNEIWYVLIFLAGCVIGSQLNRGIYRLAWYPRCIGPWSAPHPEAPPRRWSDRIPAFGWFGLRRETPIHGAGYWIRPLLIELACGTALVGLFWWEVVRGGLLPPSVLVAAQPVMNLVAVYLGHALLLCLMIVATFIDFDEQTIPDAITLPGTLIGLVWMTLLPAAALPVAVAGRVDGLLLCSPHPWPPGLDTVSGLLAGHACLIGWCLAIWPKTTTLRRGPLKAVRYMLVSMFRFAWYPALLLIMVVCCLAITLVWALGGEHWNALLTALVGMAFAGGLIWAVRLVGGSALGKEAMGFGDVTLMAMIGVYLGWQSTLLVFFLAPFVAVVICLVQWLLTRRRDIAFGPYLCTAALLVMLGWSSLWSQRGQAVFSLGWLIPQLVFFCLLLLGGMLSLWRIVEHALLSRFSRR